MKVIEVHIDQIGECMNSMKIGEINVEVTKYPTKADVQLLRNVMREYKPEYDESINEKNNQSKMKIIDQILWCPNHTKISYYSLEFKICGEIFCDLCPIMPHVL